MSERVRWGVLGWASIAVNNVIPAMQRSERCTVTAIASRDRARAAATAAQLGIPRHHGRTRTSSTTPRSRPSSSRSRTTSTASGPAGGGRGKHVLCEKPFAMTSARRTDGRRVPGGRGGVDGSVHVPLPPDLAPGRRAGRGGAIGELDAIQAFFSYRNVDPNNIRNIAEYGGGALMDIGCYPINVARWMFDSEPSVVRRRCVVIRASAPTS